MTKLILRWASLSVAFWVAASLLSEQVKIEGDWWTFAWVALIFGLANATIGTLVRLLTLPLAFLTLGLWLLALNGLLLLGVDYFSDSITVVSFPWAVAASVIISVVSTVINNVVDKIRS